MHAYKPTSKHEMVDECLKIDKCKAIYWQKTFIYHVDFDSSVIYRYTNKKYPKTLFMKEYKKETAVERVYKVELLKDAKKSDVRAH